MKKIVVIFLMLSSVIYGWSQTFESTSINENADYNSISNNIQREDQILQDTVLIEQLQLILEENSNNNNSSSKNPDKVAA